MAYEFGSSFKFKKFTKPFVLKVGDAFEGVSIYVRDETRGHYVQIFDVGVEEWVQFEPQSWSSGNFETVEAAKREAVRAYRYLNRPAGA